MINKEEALKNLVIAETAFLTVYGWSEVEEDKWYPPEGPFRPDFYRKGEAVTIQKQYLRTYEKEVI